MALEENNGRNQIEELQQKNTYFNFFPISSLLTTVSSKNIEINSFTYIRNVNAKKWLDAVINEKSMEFEEGENNSAVNPVLKENFTEKEIFRIRKAPNDLIWELKFLNVFEATLCNFFEKIKNYNVIYFVNFNFFNEGFFKKMNEKTMLEDLMKIEIRLNKIIQCIEDLDAFCRNKIGNKTFDQKFGEMNISRQNVNKILVYRLKTLF